MRNPSTNKKHTTPTPIQTDKTNCLVKIPQCQIRSEFERNFTAAAISRKPKTIFICSIQTPAFGNRASICGASASTKKGMANAVENASMPAKGHRQLPCAVMTRSVPTNGAVQVKEVSVKVEAISKAPMAFVVSLLRVNASSLLVKPAGTWMKYTPNNENAKAIKNAATRRFTHGLVASRLTPPAPKTALNS